ncbi:predicted protein, partial [Scheffersomyces stipitis CBS 6054]
MKVLKERDSFLSNYEVAEHLKEIKKKYNWTFTKEDEQDLHNDKRKNKKRFAACGVNLEVITRDILSYVSNSATASIDSTEKFSELVQFLNNYELMKVEKLQIVNSLPRSMVTLYSIVEECDQRFDEQICNNILEKI